MKLLETGLTWRLNELTSENPTTQRNLLLELYSNELEQQGVVFNKKSSNYVGGIIDKIEKAKNERNLLDSKRKEVGGIQSDLINKGIDVETEYTLKDIDAIKESITTLKVKIETKENSSTETRKNELNELKLKGIEYANELKRLNEVFVKGNYDLETIYNNEVSNREYEDKNTDRCLFELNLPPHVIEEIEVVIRNYKNARKEIKEPTYAQTLTFNENGSITSKPNEWQNEVIKDLLTKYQEVGFEYSKLNNAPIGEVDVTKETAELESLNRELRNSESYNKDAKAVIAFQNWKQADQNVKDLNKDYYLKLTEINTGVKGLHIVPEDNDIFLTYNGEYDPEYFHNPNGELRKLSAYSDTQKPMICLLIQNYLLSKKAKCLPYLWIDQVPIDKKTKALLDKMSEELGLYLFVNWTGDFSANELQEGEILIENGEVFFKE